MGSLIHSPASVSDHRSTLASVSYAPKRRAMSRPFSSCESHGGVCGITAELSKSASSGRLQGGHGGGAAACCRSHCAAAPSVDSVREEGIHAHGEGTAAVLADDGCCAIEEGIPALEESDDLWLKIRAEARRDAEREPVLASYLFSTILAHSSLDRALAFHLANKLASTTLLSTQLYNLFINTLMDSAEIRGAIRADVRAVKERDPACLSYCHCVLNFKGFQACQTHRLAHHLWQQGRQSLALALNNRVSEVFAVDIHPAAKFGRGILLDHATGVVIGETAVVGNDVSLLHHVTLGGTGKFGCSRHPKIGCGVLVGAGATILGNVKIGDGAKIGAGSVVLTDIPARTTAVGNPARLVGGKAAPSKLKEVPAMTMDHTSFISRWSDYVI